MSTPDTSAADAAPTAPAVGEDVPAGEDTAGGGTAANPEPEATEADAPDGRAGLPGRQRAGLRALRGRRRTTEPAPEATEPEPAEPEPAEPEPVGPTPEPRAPDAPAPTDLLSDPDERTIAMALPVLPPSDAGRFSDTADLEPRVVVRATGPARRPSLVVQGLWPALLSGALAAAAALGLVPLSLAVLTLQVFLVLGLLALLDAPAAGGAFLVALLTTVAADIVVLQSDGGRALEGAAGGLAGVVGLGLVLSLLHQLARKGRSRVTESLADTLLVIVASSAAACLLSLQRADDGGLVLLVSVSAAGAVLLAGRVGDQLSASPPLAHGSTRGWLGLVLGLGAGVGAAVLVAVQGSGSGTVSGATLTGGAGALLGLVVASTVASCDLAVDLGAAALRRGWRDARRAAALRPTALLLPFALLGPVALVAARLLTA